MSVTRLPTGLSTRKQTNPLGNYTRPDPTAEHQFMEDFDYYTAGDWTITVVGTSTPALVAGDGGLLGITTSATSSDSTFLQKNPDNFLMETGRPAWFKARFKVSTLATVAIMGLQITDTTPADATDGIYFISTVTTGAVTVISRKNATTGSASASAGTLVADTYTELAWYWDGKDKIDFWQDDVQKGSLTGIAASYLPDAALTISFGVQTTSANARTMTVDYIMASKTRR